MPATKSRAGRSAAKSASRTVPPAVRCILWGRAAGHCQFCNTPVYRHERTKETVNLADLAHIIGFSKDGPRGERYLSKKLASDITNLMLLCKACHRTVDEDQKRPRRDRRYTVGLLREWKAAHEERIRLAASISPDKQSTILLYGANVGEHGGTLTYQSAAQAMFPEWFPRSDLPISLGLKNSHMRDKDAAFWELEPNQLRYMVRTQVYPAIEAGDIQHLSVFAVAPQPLLMLLGFLLSSLRPVEVYQLHREPQGWRWQLNPADIEYVVTPPERTGGPAALVLGLSGAIADSRVTAVLGADAAIWRVTIPTADNDFLKSRQQLQRFRQCIRRVLESISEQVRRPEALHVFPAVPVAAAIEFGRAVMPKAHPPIKVYDEIPQRGGFVYGLDLDVGGPLLMPIPEGV